MKKVLLYVIIFNVVVLGSQAQITKTYYEYSGNIYPRDLVSSNDGGYLILAANMIIKVDQDGDLVWEKSTFYSGFRIQETNGGYYIVGTTYSNSENQGYLIKINEQGDSLWSKKYINNDYASMRNIKQLSNSDLVMSLVYDGSSMFPAYRTIKTDSLGNITWELDASEVSTSEIFELENNEILILGSDFRENQPPEFPESCWPSMIKYNNEGTVTSRLGQYHMNWAECKASVHDGQYYYFTTTNANFSILRMDDSIVHWTKNYSNFNYQSICTDLDNLYLTGSYGDINWADLFILSVTKDGDSLSLYLDSEDYNHHGKRIIIDNDNLVILGQVKKSVHSDYAVCLTIIPIQYILTGIKEKNESNHLQFNIYPNPANKKIYFNNINPGKHKIVNVYSIAGKLELSEPYVNNFIDVSKLNKGLYIVEMLSEKEKQVAKFIIN